ncbi:unnamed protein product [Rotaria socialis]
MRPALAGPGSAKWKPTQDPGKKAASTNLSGKSSGGDANSASKGANTQPNKSDGATNKYLSYHNKLKHNIFLLSFDHNDANPCIHRCRLILGEEINKNESMISSILTKINEKKI